MKDRHLDNYGPTKDDSKSKKDGEKVPIYTGCVARFPLALREVAIVSNECAVKKYNTSSGDMGYLEVENGIERYSDALLGHMLDDTGGMKQNSEDFDVLHAAQVAWCALARLEIMLRNEGKIKSVRQPHFMRVEAMTMVDGSEPELDIAATYKHTDEELVKLGSRDPDHGFVEGEVGCVRPGHRPGLRKKRRTATFSNTDPSGEGSSEL
jgi:hypothetical protein|tara:strand:+ start:1103 stop:1729 length:627 start_codon:yes stop_codon:yes gene_type:complete